LNIVKILCDRILCNSSWRQTTQPTTKTTILQCLQSAVAFLSGTMGHIFTVDMTWQYANSSCSSD